MKTLAFRTKSQVILWKHEILGQLSDGHWENFRVRRYGRQHWQFWTDEDVQTIERPEGPVGRDFHADYDGYNLTSKDLLEAVGKRMVVLVRLGLTFGEENARLLEHLCDLDGGWAGMPTYEGQYWDDLRAQIGKWMANNKQSLEAVERAVRFDAYAAKPYDRKALLADLREMKKTIKTRI